MPDVNLIGFLQIVSMPVSVFLIVVLGLIVRDDLRGGVLVSRNAGVPRSGGGLTLYAVRDEDGTRKTVVGET